jgi:hypothetical protein
MSHEHSITCLEERSGRLVCSVTGLGMSTRPPEAGASAPAATKKPRAQKKGIGEGTVEKFLLVLSSKLTQHDQREEKRDMKRGGRVNIYRLGHLLGALERTRERVKEVESRSDDYSLDLLRKAMNREFTPGFSPVMNVERQIANWIATKKEPTLIGG